MSAPARLAAFGLALVAALVLGVGLGAAFGPEPSTDPVGPRHGGVVHTTSSTLDQGAVDHAPQMEQWS